MYFPFSLCASLLLVLLQLRQFIRHFFSCERYQAFPLTQPLRDTLQHFCRLQRQRSIRTSIGSVWDGAGRALCWKLPRLQCHGHESRTCLARLSQPGSGALGYRSRHKSYYLLSTSSMIHWPNFLCPSTCTISLKNALCLGCTTHVLQKGSDSSLYLPVGIRSMPHRDCSYNTLQHKMLSRCWKKGRR